MAKMPSNDKTNIQASLNQRAGPQDAPPAYSTSTRTSTSTSRASAPRSPPLPTPAPHPPVPSQTPLSSISRLSHIPFHRYTVPYSTITADQTITSTNRPDLYGTAQALGTFISEQAALPPKPVMVVRGTHV